MDNLINDFLSSENKIINLHNSLLTKIKELIKISNPHTVRSFVNKFGIRKISRIKKLNNDNINNINIDNNMLYLIAMYLYLNKPDYDNISDSFSLYGGTVSVDTSKGILVGKQLRNAEINIDNAELKSDEAKTHINEIVNLSNIIQSRITESLVENTEEKCNDVILILQELSNIPNNIQQKKIQYKIPHAIDSVKIISNVIIKLNKLANYVIKEANNITEKIQIITKYKDESQDLLNKADNLLKNSAQLLAEGKYTTDFTEEIVGPVNEKLEKSKQLINLDSDIQKINIVVEQINNRKIVINRAQKNAYGLLDTILQKTLEYVKIKLEKLNLQVLKDIDLVNTIVNSSKEVANEIINSNRETAEIILNKIQQINEIVIKINNLNLQKKY